jgi:hypothetical protein
MNPVAIATARKLRTGGLLEHERILGRWQNHKGIALIG